MDIKKQQHIKNKIISIFKDNNKVFIDGEISLTHLIDFARKLDEDIINKLLQDSETKNHFFKNISGNYNFLFDKFERFINSELLDNSYTSFKNRIGLTVDNRYIKDSKDIVLNFPFKDCYLEGGQTKDEGEEEYFYKDKDGLKSKKRKRKEIFFNEYIAYDEIDTLLSKKAFCNFKKYTKNGTEEVKSFNRNENGIIKDNLIIKGNNLLTLHSLYSEFKGKVKLIYIDPPYNTRKDTFNYNDNFNHSAWLVFMKDRLKIAKELLSNDGSIYINIDYNEVHYLKILMDEIFGRDNFITQIIWRIGHLSGYKTLAKKYVRNYDCILFYSKTSNYFFNKNYILNKDFAPLLSKKEIDDIFNEFKFNEKLKKDFADFINYRNRGEKYSLEDTWNCSKWDKLDSIGITIESNEKILRILGEGTFVGQKPEKLIQRIIESSTKENDIILDFFAGSGTTLSVAHKMKRQYIGAEQIERHFDICIKRLKKVIEGEQGGISKNIDWTGGGEFISFEIAQHNEIAKEKIINAKNYEEIKNYFEEICDKFFLKYNLNIKEFEEKIIESEELKNLDLEKQKEIFISLLDPNQMYINYSNMEDKKYKLNKKDIELTREFYKND